MRGTDGLPIRLQYTKHGKIRWIGHRDVARAMERAFRISELPLRFTEGFSPRPKVSFGLALSTGHESDGEYLDLVLNEETDLDEMCVALTDALPEGMAVVGAAPLVDRAPALQEVVSSVVWRVDVVRDDGTPITSDELHPLITAGLARDTLPTMRRRKGREVDEDVRPVVRWINPVEIADGASTATVEMELSTQPRSAKPGEILTAIGGLTDSRALRTHQWIERDGARLEPLSADTRPRVPEACVS